MFTYFDLGTLAVGIHATYAVLDFIPGIPEKARRILGVMNRADDTTQNSRFGGRYANLYLVGFALLGMLLLNLGPWGIGLLIWGAASVAMIVNAIILAIKPPHRWVRAALQGLPPLAFMVLFVIAASLWSQVSG